MLYSDAGPAVCIGCACPSSRRLPATSAPCHDFAQAPPWPTGLQNAERRRRCWITKWGVIHDKGNRRVEEALDPMELSAQPSEEPS
jgi:hypothetical protein